MPKAKRPSNIEPDEERRSPPQADAPASVPPDADVRTGGVSPAEDGGVAQHPIHDDDVEDLQPEDFEELVEEAAERGLPPRETDESE